MADLVRATGPEERFAPALNDRLAASDHAVTLPDLVPPKAAFATVQVDAAIYAFSIAAPEQ